MSRSHLTRAQVLAIVKMAAVPGRTLSEIAQEVGVHQAAVQAIAAGRNYTSITATAPEVRPLPAAGYRRAYLLHGLASKAGWSMVAMAKALGISRQAAHNLVKSDTVAPAFALLMPNTPVNDNGEAMSREARCYRLTPPARWTTGAEVHHVIVAPPVAHESPCGADGLPSATVVFACDATGRMTERKALFGGPLTVGGDHREALRLAGYLRVEEVLPPLTR